MPFQPPKRCPIEYDGRRCMLYEGHSTEHYFAGKISVKHSK